MKYLICNTPNTFSEKLENETRRKKIPLHFFLVVYFQLANDRKDTVSKFPNALARFLHPPNLVAMVICSIGLTSVASRINEFIVE
jgi:hypothetical protein